MTLFSHIVDVPQGTTISNLAKAPRELRNKRRSCDNSKYHRHQRPYTPFLSSAARSHLYYRHFASRPCLVISNSLDIILLVSSSFLLGLLLLSHSLSPLCLSHPVAAVNSFAFFFLSTRVGRTCSSASHLCISFPLLSSPLLSSPLSHSGFSLSAHPRTHLRVFSSSHFLLCPLRSSCQVAVHSCLTFVFKMQQTFLGTASIIRFLSGSYLADHLNSCNFAR